MISVEQKSSSVIKDGLTATGTQSHGIYNRPQISLISAFRRSSLWYGNTQTGLEEANLLPRITNSDGYTECEQEFIDSR